MQTAALASGMVQALPQPHQAAQPLEAEFNIVRTFNLLTAVLVLPMFLALSVVSYSVGALL